MYVFVFNVSGIEMTLIVDDEASILRVKWVGYETSSSPKSQLHRKASTGKRDSDCTCSAGQLKYSENEVLGKTSLRVRCKQNSVQHPTIEPVHVSGVQLMFFFSVVSEESDSGFCSTAKSTYVTILFYNSIVLADLTTSTTIWLFNIAMENHNL
jgi:hypothetical protein